MNELLNILKSKANLLLKSFSNFTKNLFASFLFVMLLSASSLNKRDSNVSHNLSIFPFA